MLRRERDWEQPFEICTDEGGCQSYFKLEARDPRNTANDMVAEHATL